MGPDQLLMLGIDLPNIFIVCLGTDVDGGDALLDHLDQAGRDVAALAFRLEDHAAAMRRARIGTEHDEQVRKIRHGEAEIGGRIVAGPGLLQILAAAPGDVEPRRHLRDLEAGGDHDDIRRTKFAVRCDDALARKIIDPVGDQFDVRFCQGLEPVVVEQDALAIGRIGRHAFLDQVWTVLQFGVDEIGQLLAMAVVALVDGAIRVRPVRILAQERQQSVAIAPEHVEAVPLHVKRQMREQPLRAFGDRIGIAGDRPRPLRGALIDCDRRGAVGDRRHQLHRGGAGTDHRHAFAVEFDSLGPQGRVQDLAVEIFLAREVRRRGIVELADGADQRGRFECLLAVPGFQRRDPAPLVLIPARRRELAYSIGGVFECRIPMRPS